MVSITGILRSDGAARFERVTSEAMRERARWRMRVTGLVQGVNYRATARREAERLGLSGFARNEPDGSVTVEAEGDPEALAEFARWCAQGPPAARVDCCQRETIAPVGEQRFRRT